MNGKIPGAAADVIATRRRTGAPLPVSPAQRALHLVEQLHPGTAMHNVPVAVWLDGPLDVARLETAIGRVLERHEALRTVFPLGVAPAAEPHQLIEAPVVDLPVTRLDKAEPAPRSQARVLQLVRDWANEPFDLAVGPLTRTRLIRLGPQRHVLVVVVHQLVTDGPSMRLFFDELADAYAGRDDRPLPAVQLADHAAWQRARWPVTEDLWWWRERLAGVPTVLRLPTDRPRPPVATTRGANHVHTLPAAVMTPALAVARQLRVTPFVLMLTAYAALLARLADATDVLVGIPVSTRDRVELETAIGFFVTTLPVRVDTSGEPSFDELVGRVRMELLDVLDHNQVTFDQLVADLAPERDPARPPLVQTFFSCETAPLDPRLPGTSAAAVEWPPDEAKVDLDLSLVRAATTGDDFRMTLAYRTDLFTAGAVEQLAERYARLLATAVADPRAPLRENPVLAGIAPPPPLPPPPAPVRVRTGTDLAGAPHAGLERDLVRIWQDVLGLDEVGLHDNFFDLGGTSFALTTVHGRIRELVGTAPPLVALLEFPTVAALARHLAGAPESTPSDGAASPERLRTGRERLRQRRRTALEETR